MNLPVHELIHTGKQFNVTRERIRQIEARAMAKLRNPVKTNELKEIFQVRYCMLIHARILEVYSYDNIMYVGPFAGTELEWCQVRFSGECYPDFVSPRTQYRGQYSDLRTMKL